MLCCSGVIKVGVWRKAQTQIPSPKVRHVQLKRGLCSYIVNNKCHKFGFMIGGNQRDWLMTKAQVHQYRVERKHNIEPCLEVDNPVRIPFNNIKNNTINRDQCIRHTS